MTMDKPYLHFASEFNPQFPVIRKLSPVDLDKDEFESRVGGGVGGNNNSGKFWKYVPVRSKYSSTESDCSSDEEVGGPVPRYRRDSTGMMTLSGFSTSASSSSSYRRRRRRRRRKADSPGYYNPIHANINYGHAGRTAAISENKLRHSDPTFLQNPRSHPHTHTVRGNKKIATATRLTQNHRSSQSRQLPELNSVRDLKHATGRHRGISGSSAPLLDSVLFAMFYATDAFDELLLEEADLESMDSGRREILSILRKEIVYSLRVSYFCPAGKIMKLYGAIDDHFPLDQIRDAGQLVDLLLTKILGQPDLPLHPTAPSISTSTSHYVVQLPLFQEHLDLDLESKSRSSRRRQSHSHRHNISQHFQSSTLPSVQDLLLRHQRHRRRRSQGHFTRVAHDQLSPTSRHTNSAFIIQLNRCSFADSTSNSSYANEFENAAEVKDDGFRPCVGSNIPVIPNLEIEIEVDSDCDFIGNQRRSLGNSMMTSISLGRRSSRSRSAQELDKPFHPPPSRFLHGVKSTFSRMYRFLEDFAFTPSTHFPSGTESFSHYPNSSLASPSPPSPSSMGQGQGDNTKAETKRYSSPNSSLILTSTSSSPLNLSTSTSTSSSFLSVPGNDSRRRSHFKRVRMELIGVICESPGAKCDCDGMRCCSGCCSGRRTEMGYSGYSVYSKASNSQQSEELINGGGGGLSGYRGGPEGEDEDHDKVNKGEGENPWLLYQSRSGVAPQVSLIENFGKWMGSIETQEDLTLSQVPLEIRRVLQDAQLLIYRRVET